MPSTRACLSVLLILHISTIVQSFKRASPGIVRHFCVRDNALKRNSAMESVKSSFHDNDAVCAPGFAARLEEVLAAMKDQDHDLYVITDFDHTLTTMSSRQCHDVVGFNEKLSGKFREDFNQMCTSNTPGMTIETAWKQAHDFITEASGLTEELYDESMASPEVSSIFLRDGVSELIQSTRDARVPTIIASAGFVNIITHTLILHGVDHAIDKYFHIDANVFHFAECGKLAKISPEIPLHSYAKKHMPRRATHMFTQFSVEEHAGARDGGGASWELASTAMSSRDEFAFEDKGEPTLAPNISSPEGIPKTNASECVTGPSNGMHNAAEKDPIASMPSEKRSDKFVAVIMGDNVADFEVVQEFVDAHVCVPFRVGFAASAERAETMLGSGSCEVVLVGKDKSVYPVLHLVQELIRIRDSGASSEAKIESFTLDASGIQDNLGESGSSSEMQGKTTSTSAETPTLSSSSSSSSSSSPSSRSIRSPHGVHELSRFTASSDDGSHSSSLGNDHDENESMQKHMRKGMQRDTMKKGGVNNAQTGSSRGPLGHTPAEVCMDDVLSVSQGMADPPVDKWDRYHYDAVVSHVPPPWESTAPFESLVRWINVGMDSDVHTHEGFQNPYIDIISPAEPMTGFIHALMTGSAGSPRPEAGAALADATGKIKVIELGSGCSSSAIWMASPDVGFDVTAVDVSAYAISRAREREGAERVHWLCEDVYGLTSSPDGHDDSRSEHLNSYHIVFDMQCFHVLRGVDEGAAVEVIYDVLMPGGYAMVAVGADTDPEDTDYVAARETDTLKKGPPRLSKSDLLDPFVRKGFSVCSLELTRFNPTHAYCKPLSRDGSDCNDGSDGSEGPTSAQLTKPPPAWVAVFRKPLSP